jgi:membrane protein
MTANASEAARGRGAETPTGIPLRGWKDILWRVKDEIGNDHLTIIAAGVAFYALLALIPALAAVIAIWGMVADPATIETQIAGLGRIMPATALDLIESQMQRIAAQSSASLGFGALASILFSLWSANNGMKALIEAMQIVYDEEDDRGFVKKNALSLAMTLGAVVAALLAIGMVVAVPIVLGTVGLGSAAAAAVSVLRWPLLFVLMLGALGVVYRYGPNRDRPQWRWVSPGAIAATLLWVIGSLGFSYYVSNFGSYNETYGSIGAAVILLMWFFLTAFFILLGAELNAEAERQTRHDTTVGAAEPIGQRGAFAADDLGEAR